MGCKKTAMKIVKHVAEGITPALVAHAKDMVTVVEKASLADPGWLMNADKRRFVAASVKAEAIEAGQDLEPRAINLLTEFAVSAVKGPVDESDLGVDDTGELLNF